MAAVDFDRARDCALRCLERVQDTYDYAFLALAHRSKQPDPANDLDTSRETAAKLKQLQPLVPETQQALTTAVLDAIGLSLARAGQCQPISYNGREFSTGHELALFLVKELICAAGPAPLWELLATIKAECWWAANLPATWLPWVSDRICHEATIAKGQLSSLTPAKRRQRRGGNQKTPIDQEDLDHLRRWKETGLAHLTDYLERINKPELYHHLSRVHNTVCKRKARSKE